jgi:DNA-binding XRE family transcriptional regulator
MGQTFSAALRAHRQRVEFTQAKLARRAGIRRTDVALIEGGRRVCGEDVASRIARALKLSTRARKEFVAHADATTASGMERSLAAALSRQIKGAIVSVQAEVTIGVGKMADLLVETADGKMWIVEIKASAAPKRARRKNEKH